MTLSVLQNEGLLTANAAAVFGYELGTLQMDRQNTPAARSVSKVTASNDAWTDIQCTVYSVQCTVYSVQYTAYSI